MAKYKIIPSSRTIVRSPISIGHKAEKGVEAIEFDLTAWVETYGSGTLTVIMRRWGDAIPYPIALEIDENNKATWTLSDIDTAKAGMAYAQLNYIVGDEVVKKSDIYTFRVMDSLTGEGEPPEAYESWLEHLTHLAAEAMAEVLDIEGIVTDKTLTVDGGIADGKATGDALALKADKSTTYTKTEVDALIEDVEVETDTTLEVAGAAADAAETGRQIGLLKADLEYFRDTSMLPVFTDNISGTRYITTHYDIPAGTYTLHIESISSTDTDASTCGINLGGGSGLLQYSRNTQIDAEITLTSDSNTQYWYASNSSQASTGDTVTFNGVALSKSITDTSLTKQGVPADAYEMGQRIDTAMMIRGTIGSSDPTSIVLYPGVYACHKTADAVGYPADMITGRYGFLIALSRHTSNKNFMLIDSTDGTTWIYTSARGYISVNTKKLSAIKWAGIGDSLTYPGTTRASQKYYDYINRNTGIQFTNLGVSGTGYMNDYNGAGTFRSRIDQIPVDTNVVTIFGSVNDMTYPIGTAEDTDDTTVMGCVYLTIQGIFTQRPDVVLGIIAPTPTMQHTPFGGGNMVTFVAELRKMCEKYSIPFLDLFHESNMRPWDSTFRESYYSKDGGNGTHPDENGYKRFTPMIQQFIESLVTKFY